jgi:23S rRNA (pseudouridine1915-N3)-methyltransferase
LEVVELPDGGVEPEDAAISAAVHREVHLMVLSEEGHTFGSINSASDQKGSGSERLALVIGGADGRDQALRARASLRLSLSPRSSPPNWSGCSSRSCRALPIQQGGPGRIRATALDLDEKVSN